MGKSGHNKGKSHWAVATVERVKYRFDPQKARQIFNVRERLREQYLARRRAEEMQQDYEALKVLTSMVGDPYLKFALMEDFVYQRLQDFRGIELKNDKIGFHKIVHDDDLQHHFALGPFELLDFLERNGAQDAEGNRSPEITYVRWEPPQPDDLPKAGDWYQSPITGFWIQYTEEDIDRIIEERRRKLLHKFPPVEP